MIRLGARAWHVPYDGVVLGSEDGVLSLFELLAGPLTRCLLIMVGAWRECLARVQIDGRPPAPRARTTTGVKGSTW